MAGSCSVERQKKDKTGEKSETASRVSRP